MTVRALFGPVDWSWCCTVVVSTWSHLITAQTRWHCVFVTPTLNDESPLPMPSLRQHNIVWKMPHRTWRRIELYAECEGIHTDPLDPWNAGVMKGKEVRCSGTYRTLQYALHVSLSLFVILLVSRSLTFIRSVSDTKLGSPLQIRKAVYFKHALHQIYYSCGLSGPTCGRFMTLRSPTSSLDHKLIGLNFLKSNHVFLKFS
jgi:hypothetical protein